MEIVVGQKNILYILFSFSFFKMFFKNKFIEVRDKCVPPVGDELISFSEQ